MSLLPPIIEFLKDKEVLILGFGREGRSTYNYIRRYLPEKVLAIGDGREQKIDDENVRYFCGGDYLSHIGKFDVVMKSPGIPFRDVTVPEGTLVTCQTDLFMRYAPCKKIGVTGSRAKPPPQLLPIKCSRRAALIAVLWAIWVFRFRLPRGDDRGYRSRCRDVVASA